MRTLIFARFVGVASAESLPTCSGAVAPVRLMPTRAVKKLFALQVFTLLRRDVPALLNVFQSLEERYPLCVASAFVTWMVVPDPSSAPAPPVMVRTEEPVSVKLPDPAVVPLIVPPLIAEEVMVEFEIFAPLTISWPSGKARIL